MNEMVSLLPDSNLGHPFDIVALLALSSSWLPTAMPASRCLKEPIMRAGATFRSLLNAAATGKVRPVW